MCFEGTWSSGLENKVVVGDDIPYRSNPKWRAQPSSIYVIASGTNTLNHSLLGSHVTIRSLDLQKRGFKKGLVCQLNVAMQDDLKK